MMVWGSAVQSEGFRVFIGLGEVAVDSGLEIDDALEDAAFEPLPGQLGEEAFDGIEPGGRGRGEVEMEPRVPFEPGPHLRMLVRRIVVDDQMQFLPGRGLTVDLVEETDEFLMPMAGRQPASDRSHYSASSTEHPN